MELKNKMNILTLEKYDHDAEVEAHTKEKVNYCPFLLETSHFLSCRKIPL